MCEYSRVTHPQLFDICEMRDILYPLDEVVSDVQYPKLQILLKALQACDTVVTDVELLEISQVLEIFQLRDPI